MERFTSNHLMRLAGRNEGPCVSLFIPTPDRGVDGQQDPIRLKNLLREAEQQLSDCGLRSPEARELLETARSLQRDELFWREKGRGLAVFIDGERTEWFRLPLEMDEALHVGDRFYIKPLLPLVSGNDRFLLLALSQKSVQLYEGDRYALAEREVADLPKTMDDALRYDEKVRTQQQHTAMSPRAASSKKQASVFHGQGVGHEDKKDDIEIFCRIVDSRLHPVLRGEQAPLVMVSADPLGATFRKVSTHSQLVDPYISGSPNGLNASQLHAKAWPLVERRIREQHAKAAKQCLDGLGGKASNELAKIVPAVLEGKVETLLLLRGREKFGTFDPRNLQIEVHETPQPGDEDLTDLAAIETLRRSGTVYMVDDRETLGGHEVLAAMRY